MIKGILIDLSGTVHVGDQPVPGAVEAIRHLQHVGMPFRFVTNTSRKTRALLHQDLKKLGCEVPAAHIFTAPLAVRHWRRGFPRFSCRPASTGRATWPRSASREQSWQVTSALRWKRSWN